MEFLERVDAVSYTHLDVYKRQSLRRTKEAEKEVRAEEKEVTSVEDAEQMLPPMEPVKPVQPENQPEKPTQTEEERFQEMMRAIMGLSKKIDDGKEESKKNKEEINAFLGNPV